MNTVIFWVALYMKGRKFLNQKTEQ
jgi:hypothetical protein